MSHPDPGRILQALTAYQLPTSLKAALDLEVFTHIAAGANTPEKIAPLCQASEKGVRVLCDYLTVQGFLLKPNGVYELHPETGIFLDKKSPAYLGSVANFLSHDLMRKNFSDVTALVRKGGAVSHEMMGPDDPIWVEFARSMMPMMAAPAQLAAQKVATPGKAQKVLDIAAGHGIYGLTVAKINPEAEIWGADWANVLEVAKDNAQKMGFADRFHTIPGSAFDADLGTGYDLILVPNFFHHFDEATNVKLAKRFHAVLKPEGVLATIEFVPNEDRVTPPFAAAFAMMMLGGTDAGDAYTFKEFDRIFRAAGFGASEKYDLLPTAQSLIVTRYQ